MWIKFKNERCKIRGVTKGWKTVWQWMFAVKDYVGKIRGPVFNNIEVYYHMWDIGNEGSQSHRYWGAAMVNNAVHEFYDFSAAEGINPPPGGLDVFVGWKNDYGYALLSGQQLYSQAVGTILLQSAYFTGPFGVILGAVGWATTWVILPDVYVGINYRNSDDLKELAYHEFAHASHYTLAGNAFWERLVIAESLALGHGNANSRDAGVIALSESWAEHVGRTFAHAKYGDQNSLTFTANYRTYLEAQRNEVIDHIPIGYYNDLIDGINVNEEGCDGNRLRGPCGDIDDQVLGFTNAQLFSILDGATDSPTVFTERLIRQLLGQTVNNQQQISNLFNSY